MSRFDPATWEEVCSSYLTPPSIGVILLPDGREEKKEHGIPQMTSTDKLSANILTIYVIRLKLIKIIVMITV